MNARLTLLSAVGALAIAGTAYAAPISGQGTWESTLQGRDINGDGVTDAFYDTSLNITWLANANANGLVNWSEATSWVSDLVVGNIDDWRLPGTTDVGNDGCNYKKGGGGLDCGFLPDPTSSEMAHLYYVTLGNTGVTDDQGSPDDSIWNTGDFVDMRRNVYWSNLYMSDPTTGWGFSNYFGYQGPYAVDYRGRAYAVHDGDVAVSAVPEPASAWLMLCGLAALGTIVTKKRKAE